MGVPMLERPTVTSQAQSGWGHTTNRRACPGLTLTPSSVSACRRWARRAIPSDDMVAGALLAAGQGGEGRRQTHSQRRRRAAGQRPAAPQPKAGGRRGGADGEHMVAGAAGAGERDKAAWP